MRSWHCAVQCPGSAGTGSHCSNGTSTTPLPHSHGLQSCVQLASPALGSQNSPGSCTPLPQSTSLQETVVVRDLLHWPLLAVMVSGTSVPAPLQVKVVLAAVAAANEPTDAVPIFHAYVIGRPSRSVALLNVPIVEPTLAEFGVTTR